MNLNNEGLAAFVAALDGGSLRSFKTLELCSNNDLSDVGVRHLCVAIGKQHLKELEELT